MYYLAITCMNQTLRYLDFKTATKTTMKLERNLTFPAITICNFNLIKNDSVTDTKTRELLKALFVQPNITSIENLGEDFLETVSLRDIFIKGSPALNDTFQMCQWLNEYMDCGTLLTRKAIDFGHCDTFGSKENNNTYTVQTTGYLDGVTFTMWLNQDNYFIGDGSSSGIRVGQHCFLLCYVKVTGVHLYTRTVRKIIKTNI